MISEGTWSCFWSAHAIDRLKKGITLRAETFPYAINGVMISLKTRFQIHYFLNGICCDTLTGDTTLLPIGCVWSPLLIILTVHCFQHINYNSPEILLDSEGILLVPAIYSSLCQGPQSVYRLEYHSHLLCGRSCCIVDSCPKSLVSYLEWGSSPASPKNYWKIGMHSTNFLT